MNVPVNSLVGRVLVAGLVIWAILFFYAGLYPFLFHWPPDWSFEIGFRRRDFVRNFVAFIPFGLMIAPLARRSPLMAAAILCFILSATVEFGQQFLPRRNPSFSDLASNTLGGLLGASTIVSLRKWRRAH
jgi:glycopeptide antibiotics resistance protein